MVVGKTGIVVSPLISLMQDQVIDYCSSLCENSRGGCKLTRTLTDVVLLHSFAIGFWTSYSLSKPFWIMDFVGNGFKTKRHQV